MRQSKDGSWRRPFLWLSAGAALILVMVAILIVTGGSAGRPSRYARYVSPPLTDGTRYTFLYPVTLGRPMPGEAGPCVPLGAATTGCRTEDVTLTTPLNPCKLLMRRTEMLRRLYPQNQEDLRVSSTDDVRQPSPFPSGRRIPSESPRYRRSETVNLGGSGCRHTMTVTDVRSGARYYFQHASWSPGASASSEDPFAGDDAMIAQSFRVLPPGTTLPRTQ